MNETQTTIRDLLTRIGEVSPDSDGFWHVMDCLAAAAFDADDPLEAHILGRLADFSTMLLDMPSQEAVALIMGVIETADYLFGTY